MILNNISLYKSQSVRQSSVKTDYLKPNNALISSYPAQTPVKKLENKPISFMGGKDYFEIINPDSQDDNITFEEFIIQEITDFINRNKTRLWLSFQIPTKRNLKAFFKDPAAYFYEINRPLSGKVTNKETVADIEIENRKNKTKENASVKKVEFDDNTAIYSIQKGHERLGFIDVDFSDKGIAFVDFASTIVGREDYRNLFIILMQSMVEDYMKKYNDLPEIQAEAVPIGEININRESLYKFYGAKTKRIKYNCNGFTFFGKIVYVDKKNLLSMLQRIQNSPKRKFLLDSTKKIFEDIKSEKKT